MTTKKPTILIRVQSKTKEAIAQAALNEQRSVSNLIEVVMTEWLRQNRYPREEKRKK